MKREGDIPNGVSIDKQTATICIDCTSRNPNEVFAKGLSPFHLGPVSCCDNLFAPNVEVAWQFSKVYEGMITDGKPNAEFFKFRAYGWSKAKEYWTQDCHKKELRHPKGIAEPHYNCWKFDRDYELLGWVDSRIKIYIPLYAREVVKTEAYRKLKEWKDSGYSLMLHDFDGYNYSSSHFKMSYYDVIHSKVRSMGHAFVIGMLLEDYIKVDGDQVTLAPRLLEDPNAPACDIFAF